MSIEQDIGRIATALEQIASVNAKVAELAIRAYTPHIEVNQPQPAEPESLAEFNDVMRDVLENKAASIAARNVGQQT